MKSLIRLSLLLLLAPALSYSQKNMPVGYSKAYGHFGGNFFGSENLKPCYGPTVAIGFSPEPMIGLGVGVDVLLSKDLKFAQPYADIRFFLDDGSKTSAPYIALQPGYIIYSNTKKVGTTQVKTTGAFAGNAVIGCFFRSKKNLGFFFDAGYSNIGFTVKDKTTRYGGFKAALGVAF